MRRLFAAALLAGLMAGTQGSAAPAASACDRACLKGMVDSYLAALVAHDPGKVPIASDAKLVENTVPTKLGEGLWKTATAVPTTFKVYVPDPTAQQVGFIGVMTEDNQPIEIGLRLKLHDGQIVEMEHLIARNLSASSLKNLQTPRPGLLAKVPAAQRTPHAQMLTIGASYYEALVSADRNDAPFAEDCVRRENGMQTTSNPAPATPGPGTIGAMSCGPQLKTHRFDYIKRIEPRRVWIADVQTGLVFGLSQFRHPMKEAGVKIVDVPGVTEVPLTGRDGQPIKPFDMPAAHIFKVRDGKIHEIEAMGFTEAYQSKTGWE
jgi:hypothetical protein